jgi:2-oxoglutarate ferredoxin oxidoreductase subunit alpha
MRRKTGMAGQIINILLGGEAGQGLQTVGPILAKSLVRKGYSVHVTQTYESRVRGGHNVFAIRAGAGRVESPCDKIDILVCLNKESFEIHRDNLADDALVICDEDWKIDYGRQIVIPSKMPGEKITRNSAAVGIVAGLIGMDKDILMQVFKDSMGSSKAKENIIMIEAVYLWLDDKKIDFKPLPGIKSPQKKLLLTGHEALALGAISGGISFCSFYPMSPATSIAQTLINHSQKMGLIIEQAEDEIAAINMAIGASYAGAPSIVPTSGGGFALMTEGLSLSGISETPVVIVIAQRPGPGTGLATRTEQGDLWLALHSGHGEFPRVIYTPGNVEECFHLARKAAYAAEKYQVPVIILTDQYIAESYQDLEQFDIRELSSVNPGADTPEVPVPYKRYRITEDGISPRLLPGFSRQLVVGDSHEHTEPGHMTEDLTLRPRMVDKRLKKGEKLKEEVVLPEYTGSKNPEILFVCWGSSKGAVKEAAERLELKGKKTAALHFSQVWPLYPDNFLKYLEKAGEVICVEGNATGQLAQLIRRESGFFIEKRISRYDGLAMTPDFIMERL